MKVTGLETAGEHQGQTGQKCLRGAPREFLDTPQSILLRDVKGKERKQLPGTASPHPAWPGRDNCRIPSFTGVSDGEGTEPQSRVREGGTAQETRVGPWRDGKELS